MSDSYERHFRFYDNREKYLLFVSTCSEKQVIAERVALDIRGLEPVPPALRVFDAGMGDGTVLTRLMRDLHRQYPTVPFLIVGKEISQEDIRISLEKMADRFYEHPLTVLVLTNMLYSEAPWLRPRSNAMQAHLNWLEVPLEGSTAFEFDEQISDLERIVQDWWKTTPSERTGNPLYVTPSVLVLYRKDHEWPLAPVIPQEGDSAPRIRSRSRCPTVPGEIDCEGQSQERTCSLGALPRPRGVYGRHSVHGKGPGDGDNSWDLA